MTFNLPSAQSMPVPLGLQSHQGTSHIVRVVDHFLRQDENFLIPTILLVPSMHDFLLVVLLANTANKKKNKEELVRCSAVAWIYPQSTANDAMTQQKCYNSQPHKLVDHWFLVSTTSINFFLFFSPGNYSFTLKNHKCLFEKWVLVWKDGPK